MQAVAESRKSAQCDFDYPHVEPGEIVHHWTESERPAHPSAAIVTQVLQGGRVALSVIRRDAMNLLVADKSSVPHVNDPRVSDSPMATRYGRWDIRPQDRMTRKRIAELEAHVGLLIASVSELKAKLGDDSKKK